MGREQLDRFGVAGAGENGAVADRSLAGVIVRGLDFFGDFAETFSVPIEVAAAGLSPMMARRSRSAAGSSVNEASIGKSLKRPGVSRKRP